MEKSKKKPVAGFKAILFAIAEGVVRFILRWTIRLFYRIRVVGLENIPETGPALLVCNHVSWLDGLFIAAKVKRRIRPLVWTPMTKLPFIRLFMKFAHVIPIQQGPRAIVTALREASDALAQGELVGIFAEGAITRTGFILPFHRGLEQITRKTPVPIIPIALHGVWGSIFSYQGGKLFWKRPRQVPYPIVVAIGKPMPPDTKAWQVRQTVQQLLADCFNLDKETNTPLHRQFVRIACRHPFRSCMIDAMNGRELNAAQTLTATMLIAKRLRPLLGKERLIGLLLPTTLGGALANLAVALLGKTAVNLNYTASREAVLSSIQQCKITHIITARAFMDKIKVDLGPDVKLIYLEEIMTTIGKFEKLRTFLGIVCLPRVVTEHLTLKLGRHRSDQLATIIFSSGSTGDPKGVILSHHNIMANIEQTAQAIDILPSDRLLGVLPFFHSFGYMATLWLPILVGASVVYYPDPRQAKEIGEFAKKYLCTIMLSTPTFLRFLIRRCDKDDFKSVTLLITGAEKLPPPLAKEFLDKFGVEPLEGYGCTELSPVAAANVPDWEHGTHKQLGTRRGTIGQPIPGCAARIADRNTFETLPPGEEGLLLIYGANVMLGYLHRKEMTMEAIRDGWYVTGDIAKMDEDGFITITDRLSRFSKIAGEMVPHQRIEDEIHKILGTNDRLCAVAGIPDEKKGERLVVLHMELNGVSIQDVQKKLTESGLPNLWLPSPRSYFQIPELPVLGSGKLDLQKVKKLAGELAGKSGE